MVRLISIDPASRITGWALYENAKLKQSDIIDFSKSKLESESRLYYMKLRILNLLEEYKPQIVVVEVSRSSNNIKVQRMLSELVGVIEGWSILNKVDYVTYTPSKWRQFVRNKTDNIPKHNKELKVWDINRVKEFYPGIKLKTDDEADAILIGLARIIEMGEFI